MANTEIPQRFILKRKRRRSFFFVNIFTTIFLAQWCNWWNRVQLNPWMKMKNATVFKRLKQLEKLTHKSGENGRCILLPWILKRWHCAPSWIRKRGRGKTLLNEIRKEKERKRKKKWNESRLVEAVRFSVLELLIDFLEPADALNNANRQQKKDSTLE